MNALAAEGITAKKVPILTAVTLIPPNVLHQLGSAANGMYLLTQQAPPSDSTNPGIQQMLKELKAAGFPANANNLSPASTGAWSNVHGSSKFSKLPKSEIAHSNSTSWSRPWPGRPRRSPGGCALRLLQVCVPRRQVAGGLPHLLARCHARSSRERSLRERFAIQRRDEAVQAQLVAMPLATALFSQWTVQFALLGLATGALTALVALSLVIVHRVSGVLNFAAAALGAIGRSSATGCATTSAGPPRSRWWRAWS